MAKKKEKKAVGRAMRMFVKVKSRTTKEREPDKPDKKSIAMFAQVREEGKVVMTANLNLNNIEGEGERFLKKAFGVDIAPGTPIVMDLYIPKGNVLDDWEKAMVEQTNHPDQTDLEDDL